MKTKHLPNSITFLLVAFGVCSWGAISAFGQSQVYAARVAATSTTVWDSPFYWIAAGGSAYSTSTGKSAATSPVGTPTRVGCYFHTASTMSVGEGYGLTHSSGTAKGAIYRVWVTLPSSNVSTDIIMNVGSTNCDIGDVFGATSAGGFTNTTAFQSGNSANKWGYICVLTNRADVTKPHIDFKYVSGGVVNPSFRNYADCIYFEQTNNPCVTVGPCTIPGPVATNMATVSVLGVTNADDLAVIVYQKAGSTISIIGQLTSGIVANAPNEVPVTWTATSLGAQVCATCIDPNGIESCQNFSGALVVGGGANPRIRVFLNCKTAPNNGNAGPVGAACDSTGTPGLFFMPGTAEAVLPGGGIVLNPSTNWQTVVIDPRTVTKSYIWSGTGSGGAVGAAANVSTWCGLEGIDFQMDDTTDTGPFDILIDNVYSGPDLLVNFETDWTGGSYTNGEYGVFLYPGFAGFPVGQFEGTNTFYVVSNRFAVSGTNVGEWKWQFSGGSTTLWVRNLMANETNRWNSPQIHMDAPFQFDMLVLPKNATQAYAVGTAPPLADVTNCPSTPFTVAVHVTPPVDTATGQPLPRSYTYQWSKNGTAIGTANQSSYTLPSVASSDSGTYSVVVGDGSGNTLTRQMILTVPTAVQIDNQPMDQGPIFADGFAGASFGISASIPGSCPCNTDPAITYRWLRNGVPLSNGGSISGATTPTLVIQPVRYVDAGTYTCVVTNTCTLQTAASTNAMLWVQPNQPAVTVSCGQQGLLDLDWTNKAAVYPPNPAFTGAPAATNAVNDHNYPAAPVNYDWSTNSFAPVTFPNASNNFALRFMGTFQPPFDPGAGQVYTFYVRSDDGARLWVNGQLIIDSWINQSVTTRSGSILLTTNLPVSLILEYFENTGNASVQLSYSSPSIPTTDIPGSQVCPAVPGEQGSGGIPPMINLSAPANNTTNVLPGAVALTADVTPWDATINSVQFYNGATLLGTVPAPGPYTQNWSPPAPGVYDISARLNYNGTSVLFSPTNRLTMLAPLTSSVTISNIVYNGDGTVSIRYGGGGGAQFTLMKSATIPTYPPNTRDTWTPVKTNSATPGVFINITPAGENEFYIIQSK